MKRIGILALLALGGCAHAPGGSVSGGECKFLERPVYAVHGVRQYDQDWIDSTIEGGVGACGWQRPAARPAELDAPVVKKAKPAARPVKPWLRFLHGLRKSPPAPEVAAPPAEFEPPPPAPPRRPIDELLGTLGGGPK